MFSLCLRFVFYGVRRLPRLGVNPAVYWGFGIGGLGFSKRLSKSFATCRKRQVAFFFLTSKRLGDLNNKIFKVGNEHNAPWCRWGRSRSHCHWRRERSMRKTPTALKMTKTTTCILLANPLANNNHHSSGLPHNHSRGKESERNYCRHYKSIGG